MMNFLWEFFRIATLCQWYREGNLSWLVLPIALLLLYHNWTDMGVDHERAQLDQLRHRVGYLTKAEHE